MMPAQTDQAADFTGTGIFGIEIFGIVSPCGVRSPEYSNGVEVCPNGLS